MHLRRLSFPLLAAALAATGSATAACAMTPAAPTDPATAAAASGVRLQRIGSFDQPVDLTAPAGDRKRLFVAEKTGRIVVVRPGPDTTFLDLSARVSGGNEQGLLGVAFSPDYARDRRFYVNYTDRAGNTRVVAYRASRTNPDRALPASAQRVITITQPFENHNGGQIRFGPDGYLYIGMGDGGGGGDPQDNAQNPNSLLGKMLRIDPRPPGYRVPADNPVVAGAGRTEVWASGLRNPWRFAFAPNRSLVIADVGQDQWEEINVVSPTEGRGANFGWNRFEGPDRYESGAVADTVTPRLSLSHADGWCSITGGVVVRDPALPTLQGRYLYGDLCRSGIRSISVTGAPRDRATGLTVPSLVAFGEDGRKRVYTLSINGPVSRLVPR